MKKSSAQNLLQKPRACFFCIHGIEEVDYKNVDQIRRFTSSYAKIVSRRRSGVCSKHQRKVANAIKRARVMALLPYTNR